MSDTTQNPLVVGLNDTTNSDKRIFGSDGNVTMKSFADSPELFASTCANLIARMLDTVPREVQLTEIITPLRVKLQGIVLSLAGDTLKLSGEVWLWNTTADPQRTVRLLWDDHLSGTGNATLTASGVSSAAAGRYNVLWYTFSPDPTNPPDGLVLLLSASAGITSMCFVVDGTLEDQGGMGFAVQDGFVYSETSCSISQASPFPWRMDVAVRDGFNPTRVFLERMSIDSTGGITILETDIARPAQPIAVNTDHSIWSINVNGTDACNGHNIPSEPPIPFPTYFLTHSFAFSYSVFYGHTHSLTSFHLNISAIYSITKYLQTSD